MLEVFKSKVFYLLGTFLGKGKVVFVHLLDIIIMPAYWTIGVVLLSIISYCLLTIDI